MIFYEPCLFVCTGWVSTIAGVPGHPGHLDGPGGTSLFSNGMSEIVCLEDGSLDVSDNGNSAVRQIQFRGEGCPQVPSETQAPPSASPPPHKQHGMRQGIVCCLATVSVDQNAVL